MPSPKPKAKEAPEDPYADWSDEDKADWEKSAPQRERLKAEISGGVVESIKDLFFNDPDGGEVTDDPADEENSDLPPKATRPMPPFWDRQLFGKKK